MVVTKQEQKERRRTIIEGDGMGEQGSWIKDIYEGGLAGWLVPWLLGVMLDISARFTQCCTNKDPLLMAKGAKQGFHGSHD